MCRVQTVAGSPPSSLMATIDYVEIPSCATRLRSDSVRPETEVKTSLPSQTSTPLSSISATSGDGSAQSNTTLTILLPQLLLSSALPSGAATTPVSAPGAGSSNEKLTSKRDPLSIPITTTNFRRFVARVGPVFWLQDRVEEIVLWRRGTRVTCTWLSVYAFLCYFPKLFLLLPHVILLGIILSSTPTVPEGKDAIPPPMPTYLAGEASTEWMANIQGIQNLMGVASDIHDLITPIIPHLTFRSPYTYRLLLVLIISFPPLLMTIALPYLPLRLLAFCALAVPILALHPRAQALGIPALLARQLPQLATIAVSALDRLTAIFKPSPREPLSGSKMSYGGSSVVPGLPKNFENLDARRRLVALLTRFADNDCLSDAAWSAEIREVELFENERWAAMHESGGDSTRGADDGRVDATIVATGTWSKAHLKSSERSAWTRGRDGWSAIGEKGYVSNLTFSLASGWAFVESEGWRRDVLGLWVGGQVDDEGWTYTSDAWMDPRPNPTMSVLANASSGNDARTSLEGSNVDHHSNFATTRRRRWVRRIYYRGQDA
ncbi:hypothetical protein HGRIS_006227 [Hohenbuehelia grisea]|uniref:TECPR1-like DysF domain-containing protein n=1 Tax=Hohenbuehelia grisea TaxID=104357 RepID=A0ABR3JZB1_9AGAR